MRVIRQMHVTVLSSLINLCFKVKRMYHEITLWRVGSEQTGRGMTARA